MSLDLRVEINKEKKETDKVISLLMLKKPKSF